MSEVLTKLDVKALTGKSGLVVFFFPKAQSSVCTIEVHEFNQELSKFEELGYNVVGVSVSSVEDNTAFTKAQGLNYPLISDLDHSITKQFDDIDNDPKTAAMLGMKEWAARNTFILDPTGKVITKVKEELTAVTCAKDALDAIVKLGNK